MGVHQGLDLLAGKVMRFPEKWLMVNGERLMINETPIVNPSTSSGQVRQSSIVNLKVPHMGWNQLEPAWENPLLAGIKTGDYAYFVHSYYCDPVEATAVLAWTDYGFPFASVVVKDNLYGLQFHPEKSQSVGLSIIQNFVELA
jgi:imidazole glycerol phosphate synthase glutamine amidotransferase subunit